MKKLFVKIFSLQLLCVFASLSILQANPTGGTVTAGSASINTAPGTVTITQASNTAIINWNSFSIDYGQLTKFIQPTSSSAVLNRVISGQTSLIDGTLSANGQVYLINGNGIVVGTSGKVNTSGFIASTRDIADSDFLSGNLHFSGSNNAGVQNFGVINALGGDAILIGKTVSNAGTMTAANGTVGLAAGDDVLIAQLGTQHVFVNPVTNPTSRQGLTGVSNSGKIAAAAAELRAANGNIYALAINNAGTVRATGVQSGNGHIWLVADTGTVVSTGTIQTSNGGYIETSGGKLGLSGKVSAGQGGDWLIDPTDLIIGTTGSVSSSPTVSAALLGAALTSGTNETVTASGVTDDGNITVSSPVTWTSTASLELSAAANITIKSAITGAAGQLSLNGGNSGTLTDTATINVGTFDLLSGHWTQNIAKLPAFFASNFEITGGTFLRAAGGSGTAPAPYLINDAYGLQGIAGFSALNFTLAANIDATGTANWNSGAGFVPITSYSGTLNGAGHTVNGLTIVTSSLLNAGLIGTLTGDMENLGMTNVNINANADSAPNVGAIAGTNEGTISQCYSTGSLSGSTSNTWVGGLVGVNNTGLSNSYSLATVSDGGGALSKAGGLVGIASAGTITNSYSAGPVISTSAGTTVGGLVGSIGGGSGSTTTNSYWSTTSSGQAASALGTGLTTTQMLTSSNFDPSWDFNDKIKGNTEIWDNINGSSLPFLHMQFPAGAKVITGTSDTFNEPLSILVGKTLTPYTAQTFADGFYQLLLPIASAPTATTVAVLSTNPADPEDALGEFSSTNPAMVHMDLAVNETTIGGGAGQTISLKTVTAPLLTYTGTDLLFTPGASNITLKGNAGLVDTYTPLTFDINVTGQASTLNLGFQSVVTGTGSFTGQNLLLGPGAMVKSFGPVTVGTFNESGGSWVQSGTLPAFSAVNFVLSGGTFLRVTGGSGTVAKPYLINDVYGLEGIGGFNSSNFTLATNIDARTTSSWNSGAGFVPIANYSGTLNGAGHTVNGLTIVASSGLNVGLIGSLTGEVENLGVINVNMNGNADGAPNVGAIAGTDEGTISQCYSTGSLSGATSDTWVGGLVGESFSGSILNSYSLATVTDGGGSLSQVGGLVGDVTGTSTITNSYSTGSVISTSAGTVVGGLVGTLTNGTVTNSYWDLTTSGQATSAAGTGLTNLQMQLQPSFKTWDFTKVWVISPTVNHGLPYLRSQLNK